MKFLIYYACHSMSGGGKEKPIESEWFYAVSILSMSTTLWIGIFFAAIMEFVFKTPTPMFLLSPLLLIVYGTLYFAYVKDGKIKTLVDEFNNKANKNIALGRITSFLYTFSSIVVFMLFSLMMKGRI